jgi:hypothetical protein
VNREIIFIEELLFIEFSFRGFREVRGYRLKKDLL